MNESRQDIEHSGKRWQLWRPQRLVDVLAAAALAVAFAALAIPFWQQFASRATLAAGKVKTPDELAHVDPSSISEGELARINLVCSQGLGSWESKGLAATRGSASNADNLETSLAKLSRLVEDAKNQTAAGLPEFQKNSGAYEGSEALFRLVVVDRALSPGNWRADFRVVRAEGSDVTALAGSKPNRPTGFESVSDREHVSYRRPESLFISGVVSGGQSGTVVNLPFLYVIVGRELGYPLRLALAKGHVFVRWEGVSAKETFDVEITLQGLRRTTDRFYERWPAVLSPEEVFSGGYLQSLTPREEAALCVIVRAACLEESGQSKQAAEMQALAERWTTNSAVLDQMGRNMRLGGTFARVRLGELADRQLILEEMRVDAERQHTAPGFGGPPGIGGFPGGFSGSSSRGQPGHPSGPGSGSSRGYHPAGPAPPAPGASGTPR